MPPPGATEIASQTAEGDHSTELTGSSSVVTSVGQPPSVGAVQTCGTPLISQTKARVPPLGEKLGEPHRPMRAMRVTAVVNSSVVEVGVSAATTTRAENKTTATTIRRMQDLLHERCAQRRNVSHTDLPGPRTN